jgi:23S rRNA (uracil1939-C5)-methyltransferase
MKKNETYTAAAEAYTSEGLAVCRVNGVVLFVPGLLRGEEAVIGVTAMKKNYGYARVIEITKPSEHRVKPACSVYRLCGGCTLQHMDETEQRFFKEDKLKTCFKKNAHMEINPLPIIRTKESFGYRNKVQIPVRVTDGKVEMGFYQNHTNRIIPFDSCLVQSDLSNAIALFVKQKLEEYGNGEVFRHLLIKHAHKTGEVMVGFIVRSLPFARCDDLVKDLQNQFPQIQSIVAIENKKDSNVILDGKEVLLAGRSYIEEELLGCRFRISARSFYQINPYATEKLYSTALKYAALNSEETLIDLYCGTGTMGIIGSKKAKHVYGIEIVEDAVRDAKINAKANNADNITFFVGDAGKGAQHLIEENIHANVVIVDPPRKGCSRETLDAIETISPDRLVYVSCDPSTLARDAAILKEKGYEIQKIQPVDMFPQTVHVETVVLMSRVEGK